MAKHETNTKNMLKALRDVSERNNKLYGLGAGEKRYVKQDIGNMEDVHREFKKPEELENGTGYKDGEVIDLQRNALFDLIDGLCDVIKDHGVHDDFEVPRGIGKVPFIDDMEFTGFNPGEIAYIEPLHASHYTGMKTSHFYDIYGKAGNYSTPRYAPRTMSAYTMMHHIIHGTDMLNYDMEMDLRDRYRRIIGYDFNESADWSYEAITLTKIPLHYVATYRNSRMLFLLTLGFTTALADPMLKRVFWYSIEHNSIIPKTKSEVEKDMDNVRNALKPNKVVPQLVIWDSISAYQQPRPLRGYSHPKTNKKWGVQ